MRNRLAILVAQEIIGEKLQWNVIAVYNNALQAGLHYRAIQIGESYSGKMYLHWDLFQGVSLEQIEYKDCRYGGVLESSGMPFDAFKDPARNEIYLSVYDAITSYLKGSS